MTAPFGKEIISVGPALICIWYIQEKSNEFRNVSNGKNEITVIKLDNRVMTTATLIPVSRNAHN